MKKILAVLSVVAMMFASCTPDNGGNTTTMPTFPELQELTVESGKPYDITFSTDKAWTISLSAEAQVYATLTYTYEDGFVSTDTQFYGEAGEHTITVNVREGLMSYAKDYVFTVDMTLEDYTQSIAKLTIPRTPYEIKVFGSAPVGMEENVLSQFVANGHPENGPFVSVPNKYSVLYLNKSDALYGDYVVAHDFDREYEYVVYAKNSDGVFAPITEDNEWLNLRKFNKNITADDVKEGKYKLPNGELVQIGSYKAFSLEMQHSNAAAVSTEGLGYEAYVNIEDENGDAIVSIYFIYNPNAVPPVPPAVQLAYPSDAAANGVSLIGEDVSYTMTIPSVDFLNHKATAFKITGMQGGGFSQETLLFKQNEEDGMYYIILNEEKATLNDLSRENTLIFGASNADGAKEYTISVILDWLEPSPEEPELPESEE